MANSSFRDYIKSFGSMQGLLASIGVLIPGASYFTSYAPPLFQGATLLTPPIALAIIIATYKYEPKKLTLRKRLDPKVGTAVVALAVSIMLFIGYLFLLKFSTVVPPAESQSSERFQVGFGKAAWSLTAEGKRTKALSPQETIQGWMLDRALFVPHGPERLWKPWSVNLAGTLNILAFLTSFVLWSFGWALLARHHADVLKAKGSRARRPRRAAAPTSAPAQPGPSAPTAPPA